MAGLASAAQQPQQEPSPASQIRVDENDMQAPDPGEQEQYERAMRQMIDNVLYPNGEANPEILANLRGDFAPEALAFFEAVDPPITDSPADALATTAAMVTMLVETSVGEELSDDVTFHVGRGAIEELADMAEAASVHDFSEREIEGAFYRAVDIYRVGSPRADPIALTETFQGIMQADKEGRLDQALNGRDVLPGLPGGPPLQQQQQQGAQ